MELNKEKDEKISELEKQTQNENEIKDMISELNSKAMDEQNDFDLRFKVKEIEGKRRHSEYRVK